MVIKEFAFELNDKVTIIASGVVGVVSGLSVSKGMSVNRIGVQYVTETKASEYGWFDEDELAAVQA